MRFFCVVNTSTHLCLHVEIVFARACSYLCARASILERVSERASDQKKKRSISNNRTGQKRGCDERDWFLTIRGWFLSILFCSKVFLILFFCYFKYFMCVKTRTNIHTRTHTQNVYTQHSTVYVMVGMLLYRDGDPMHEINFIL